MHNVLTLQGSWEAYEDRKQSIGQDPNCFSPENLWEFNFLADLIQSARPHLDQITVILAMRDGMRRTVAPRPRQHFVDMVMNNLSERENQWALLMESMGEGVNISRSSFAFPYIAN